MRALESFNQGPEVAVPGKVLCADNLKGSVKAQAAPPTVSVALSVNTGLGTETASGSAKEEAAKQSEKKRDASSILTVDSLGMGEGKQSDCKKPGECAGK